jgi:hypothetical protein
MLFPIGLTETWEIGCGVGLRLAQINLAASRKRAKLGRALAID